MAASNIEIGIRGGQKRAMVKKEDDAATRKGSEDQDHQITTLVGPSAEAGQVFAQSVCVSLLLPPAEVVVPAATNA